MLLALAAAMGTLYFINAWNVARLRWLDDHLALAIVVAAVVCTLAEIVTMWRKRRAPMRALPAWEAAVARWNRLHYCFRCDRVFLQTSGVPVPPTHAAWLVSAQTLTA
jgi:hypothetical protein